MSEVLLLIAVRAKASEAHSAMAALLGAAAFCPQYKAEVYAEGIEQLTANDADRLRAFFGWDALDRLGILPVRREAPDG